MTSKRTLEKLEIERRYWHQHQVDWGLVTEKEMHPVVVQNCRLLRDYLALAERQLPPPESAAVEALLTAAIHQQAGALRTLALACDQQLGLAHGTSLTLAYHLMAVRRWPVDWQQPIDPGQPVRLVASTTTGVSA